MKRENSQHMAHSVEYLQVHLRWYFKFLDIFHLPMRLFDGPHTRREFFWISRSMSKEDDFVTERLVVPSNDV